MAHQDSDTGWRLKVAGLQKDRAKAVSLLGNRAIERSMSDDLGILRVDKLRFQGALEPLGKADWRLKAMLGATVTQPCVVTLEPVTTRIDEPVERVFLAGGLPEPEGGETEIPEDDSVEALGDVIDLMRIATEALSLALPVYPRADGAILEDARFTEPGQEPMTDEEARPFAGLKGLRDQLSDKPE